MIVECTGCRTRYKISDERVPASGVKVKCPKCMEVFEVKKEVEEREETLGEKLFGREVVRRPLGQATAAAGDTDALRREEAPPGEPEETRVVDAGPEPDEERPRAEQAGQERGEVTAEEDARTLARALVSDILFYNRKERDEGLAQDKILAYLGKEIARSWEIYKERVGIETAVETDHFREAVNEILAEGKNVL